MRILLFFIIFSFWKPISAKEWKCLKEYKKVTKKEILPVSDWLKSDRKKNTKVWHNANVFNLNNNLSKEYSTIKQRRDFYVWYNDQINKKGHKVVWPKMAEFISSKMSLTQVFPFKIFIKKKLKKYSSKGSELVFNNVFVDLNLLYKSKKILVNEAALNWDKNILYKEQYIWLQFIYKKMDLKAIKNIERIAKGKFLYRLFVPKSIRFNGNISNPEDRYKYALKKIRVYCKDY